MDVSNFLETNFKRFQGWECDCCTRSSPSSYDSLVEELRDILRRHSLIGYHCTRLTKEEIESIRVSGMVLQNSESLDARIDRLLHDNLIDAEVACRLKGRNQADDDNRSHKLWFCFYNPSIASESGIGRFFRSWGGEALYNSHESDPYTGKVLRTIGTPCIIKVNVPIESMKESKFPDGAMARVLLSNYNHQLRIPIEHGGYSIKNIPVERIIEIIEHPSKEFNELAKCDGWSKYAI